MKIVNRLSNELLSQNFGGERQCVGEYESFSLLARGYASVENALAVLSDVHTNSSYIYYGGFARALGIVASTDVQHIGSIWEESILKRIHPDDLYSKYMLEFRFFKFVKHLTRINRGDYYLAEKVRMKDAQGNYISVLHRMFYITAPTGGGIRFALCLYTPLLSDIPSAVVLSIPSLAK